jgi:hypothetical protein
MSGRQNGVMRISRAGSWVSAGGPVIGSSRERWPWTSTRQLSTYRSLLAYPELVGLEFPADKFIALACSLPGPGGPADRRGTGLRPQCLRRTLEQALPLARLVRTHIGITGFVAYRGDHLGAAGDLGAASLPPHSRQQSKPSLTWASENSLPHRHYGIPPLPSILHEPIR